MTPSPVPLSGSRFQNEPAALYREMRLEHGPVVPVVLDGGIPAWLVLGYRELHQLTGDTVLFSRDSGLWNQRSAIPDDWPLLPIILRRIPLGDAPSAAGLRERAAVSSGALEDVDLFELRGLTERFADELIDTVCGTGEADLVADYAMRLPLQIIAALCGFTDEQGPGLVTALNDLLDGQERANDGLTHLVTSATELLAARRARPADDMASWMVGHGNGLSDQEIVESILEIAVVAHQSTADWIGNSLRLMLTDERFAASLFGGRSSVAQAMSEVLWEETPLQNWSGRWASRDTYLGGRQIRAGDLLLLGLQGANHDPHVRTPGAAQSGGNNAHFSFSHGEHRCPFRAQEMAEIIAGTAIEVILDRLPDVDLAVPADSLTYRPSPWMRGLTALPVKFTPTPALRPAT
ncbi:cytochrome P450 [Streptomyces viridiviolaceus]|uniref:Cytochrome P450 n=1 Tax=Streptomyces viridiviolaceus TaxID=68282 RepID=A0ABW2DWF6_9ACTN|nr:cytochrome P450 [Streptomyces viridiviolaceus]GHB73465.1 cytochrome P450 [Streptomyces viridiviolaceus]